MPTSDDTQPHLTADQEVTVAMEFIRVGFARLQAAATNSVDSSGRPKPGPHAKMLRQ